MRLTVCARGASAPRLRTSAESRTPSHTTHVSRAQSRVVTPVAGHCRALSWLLPASSSHSQSQGLGVWTSRVEVLGNSTAAPQAQRRYAIVALTVGEAGARQCASASSRRAHARAAPRERPRGAAAGMASILDNSRACHAEATRVRHTRGAGVRHGLSRTFLCSCSRVGLGEITWGAHVTRRIAAGALVRRVEAISGAGEARVRFIVPSCDARRRFIARVSCVCRDDFCARLGAVPTPDFRGRFEALTAGGEASGALLGVAAAAAAMCAAVGMTASGTAERYDGATSSSSTSSSKSSSPE